MEESSQPEQSEATFEKEVVKLEESVVSLRNLPEKNEAVALLKKMGLPHNIINHQLAVMRKARDIAYNITKSPIDINLVMIGAILHDIGRVKSHGLEHAAIGGDILRQLGYPDELARIAETHSLGGFTIDEARQLNLPQRDYMPRTIEEKIVCLADKFISGTEKVSIEQRFQRWIEKYGETEFLLEQIRRVKKIEEEILRLIH